MGKVTLKTMCKDKVICTQHFNSGSDTLFKAYALAMSGQDVSHYLPTYINIGEYIPQTEKFTSMLQNETGVSVVRTYVEDSKGHCTRITITLTNNMFKTSATDMDENSVIQIRLLSGRTEEDSSILATLNLADIDDDDIQNKTDFLNTISTTPTGTQLIIVWDLYITNKEVAS